MNDRYLTITEDDATENWKGLCYALALLAAIIVAVLIIWLGVQRAEILIAVHGRETAQQQLSAERAQMNAERAQMSTTTSMCYERASKAEAERADAESRLQIATQAKDREEDQLSRERQFADKLAPSAAPAETPNAIGADNDAPQNGAAPSQSPPPPTVEGITAFIRDHLAKRMLPPEAELADYSPDGVDFHDKPRATLQTIRAEREYLAQQYPKRVIRKDQVTPSITAVRDPFYGWVATAIFDYQWVYSTRTGVEYQGTYRDTWKIVPNGQRMVIISEHSIDAVTGRPRD